MSAWSDSSIFAVSDFTSMGLPRHDPDLREPLAIEILGVHGMTLDLRKLPEGNQSPLEAFTFEPSRAALS